MDKNKRKLVLDEVSSSDRLYEDKCMDFMKKYHHFYI